MESCSTLPTVIILTSVGWEVKRITLPPTDRPSKNSDKNTPLYFFFFLKEGLELTELEMKCPEVLKMWAGFSAFHCKGRAGMWSGVTPKMTNLALSTNIQGVLQCVYIYIYILRNREHGICLGRIYSLVKDISNMKQCQPNRYIIKSCLTW